MKERTDRWNIADLLDYDYFQYSDRSIPPAERTPRDRAIYLASGTAKTTKRKLAQIWLNARRDEGGETALPGETFRKIDRILNWIIAGAGLFPGMLYGWGVLKYTGTEAINLLLAFSLLVFFPLLFAFFSLLTLIFRRYIGRNFELNENTLIQKLYQKLTGLLISSEQKRRGIETFFNNASIRLRKYGAVPTWILSARLQYFALAFQIGSLLAVLLSGTVHDLAFAWQTTTNIAPDTIHNFVTTLSTPWRSWAENGCPTPQNIAGSRVVLKDGLAALNSHDLSAWWQFICYSMLFYAVIPRTVLLLIAWVAEKVSIMTISFNDPESSALFRRMRSPRIAKDTNSTRDPQLRDSSQTPPKTPDHHHENTTFSVLIPDDITPIDKEMIAVAVETNLHVNCTKILTISLDEEEDGGLWSQIPPGEPILLLLEGWQACTLEHLDYIRAMRQIMKKEQLLVVGLIGQTPLESNTPLKIDSELFSDWQYHLSTLRDPALTPIKFIIESRVK